MTDTPTTSGMGLLLGILLGPFIAVPVIFLFILMLYTGLNYCELASAPLPAFRWWQWPWGWPGVRLTYLFAGSPRLWCSPLALTENLLFAAEATAINVTVALMPLIAPLWVFQAVRVKGQKV